MTGSAFTKHSGKASGSVKPKLMGINLGMQLGDVYWLKLVVAECSSVNDIANAAADKKEEIYIKIVLRPQVTQVNLNANDIYGNKNPYSFSRSGGTDIYYLSADDEIGITLKTDTPDVVKISIGDPNLSGKVSENGVPSYIENAESEKDYKLYVSPYEIEKSTGYRKIPVRYAYKGTGTAKDTEFYIVLCTKDYKPQVRIVASEGAEVVDGVYQTDKGSNNLTLKAEVTSVLEGEDLSYSWSTEGKQNFSDEDTITPFTEHESKKGYYCTVTKTVDGIKFSTQLMVEVYTRCTYASPPYFAYEPEDKKIVKGVQSETVLRSFAHSNDASGKITYQWYQSGSESGEGTAIEGATSGDYKPDNSTAGRAYYYCVATSTVTTTSGNIDSASVKSKTAKVDTVSLQDYFGLSNAGTEEDPLRITQNTTFEKIREAVSDGICMEGVYFRMGADITLPNNWTAIGSLKEGYSDEEKGVGVYPFMGNLDGGGYTLTIPAGCPGLFDYVREASVKNMKIQGSDIRGSALLNKMFIDYGGDGIYNTGVPDTIVVDNVTLLENSKTSGSGLLKGSESGANYVLVKNCTVQKNVTVGSSSENYVGSFVGFFNGEILNCVSYADVSGHDRVGGIAGAKGQSMGRCRIVNCAFYGNVTATGEYSGGILGAGYDGGTSSPNTPVASILNCYATGTIEGNENVGGIFGGEPSCMYCWSNGAGSVSDNHFAGTVSGDKNVGGIIGFMKSIDKYQGIENNYYIDTCGVDTGIGDIENIVKKDGSYKGKQYGIDYEFVVDEVCRKTTGEEFANGFVLNKLNSSASSLKNWQQRETEAYPTFTSDPVIYSIAVGGDYKTAYYVGETLSKEGMVITAFLTDGTEKIIELNDANLEFSGLSAQKAGVETVTVKYGAIETSFDVTVTYKEPKEIKVYFTLLGDSNHGESGETHTLRKGNLSPWISRSTYTAGTQNTTVKDVLEYYAGIRDLELITSEGQYGYYVEAIVKDGVQLGEFTNGTLSGWMYTVNGTHPNVGAANYYLKNGDEIILHYTDDYTKEEGTDKWLTPGKEEVKEVTTSGASGSAVTTVPTEVKVSGTTATVTVTKENAAEMVKQATENKSAEIVLQVSASDTKDAKTINVSLDTATVKDVVNKTNATLTVKSAMGNATLDRDTLKKISDNAKGTSVIVELTKAEDGKTLNVKVTSGGETLYTSVVEEPETMTAEQVKENLKSLKLTARSTKTSKKNVKVTLKLDKKNQAVIDEIKDAGYTVKYKFYRSTKKASKYVSKLTSTTGKYTNTGGKKGTKYYYKARVQAFDTEGKLIAQTALKQCKYASRTWTK